MTPIRSALASDLADLAQHGRLREVPNEDEDAPTGDHVDFCSNDYLGLARDPTFSAAASDAARELGAGAGASRLLGGGSAIHRRVERATASWLDDAIGAPEASRSDGLFFVSGYQANVGLLGALAMAGDTIFSDADNHASIIDGCRLARAEVQVFAHNDVDDLSARLAAHADRRRRIVVTEGVFSMGGDRAPIAELLRVCDRHDAWLVVDEAHAIGVLGKKGAGATADAMDRDRTAPREPLLARVVTGGKALGVSGAIAVGPVGLRDVLLNRARSQVFSTAASPATAGAFLTAVQRVREANTLREAARDNALRLASGLGQPTPDACIVPVVIGEDAIAMEVAGEARRRGFDVRAVRPPTVPEGTARLRLVARATQTSAQIDALCSLLNDLRPQVEQQQATTKSIAASSIAEPEKPILAKPTLFIVGTDTGVGKTVASAVLLRAARRGMDAHYWKPVQTGDEDDTSMVSALAGASPTHHPAYEFPLPASPHEAAAAVDKQVDVAVLSKALATNRSTSELLIAEPAGGLYVPLVDSFTQLDWITEERAPVVLVARSGLGTLNHTLLSLAALAEREIPVRGLILCGDPHPSNYATLERMSGVTPVVQLPLLAPLESSTIDRWIDENEPALAEILRP